MKKFLLLCTLLAGCSSEKDTNVSFLALGDSYTIGESVLEEHRWPNQLANAISHKEFSVTIIAKTGWTTNELADGILQAETEPKYDLVSLLIGVNNQYRGWPISEFEKDLYELIERAISFSERGKSNVIILSIPDWSAFPFAEGQDLTKISGEIDAFNDIVKKAAGEYGVIFFDITDISRMAPYNSNLIADDLLHPSKDMYALWVDKIINSQEFKNIDF